jgi:hypothetical protein
LRGRALDPGFSNLGFALAENKNDVFIHRFCGAGYFYFDRFLPKKVGQKIKA